MCLDTVLGVITGDENISKLTSETLHAGRNQWTRFLCVQWSDCDSPGGENPKCSHTQLPGPWKTGTPEYNPFRETGRGSQKMTALRMRRLAWKCSVWSSQCGNREGETGGLE